MTSTSITRAESPPPASTKPAADVAASSPSPSTDTAATEPELTSKVLTMTLYDRMGGEERINHMTRLMFEEIAKRQELDKFFVNVPVDAIRTHQAKFFKVLFGPEEERPTPEELLDYMIVTHVRLFRDIGLDETHFDIIGECFGIVMGELEFPPDQVEESFAIIGPLRAAFEYGARVAEHEKKMDASRKATLPPATMYNKTRTNLSTSTWIGVSSK